MNKYMMKPGPPQGILRCSFCRKTQDVVAKLISSPKHDAPAYICDECVSVCNSILDRDARSGRSNAKKTGWIQRVKSWWTYGMIGDASSTS